MQHAHAGVEHDEVAHQRQVAQPRPQGRCIGRGGCGGGKLVEQGIDHLQVARQLGGDGMGGAGGGGFRAFLGAAIAVPQQAEIQPNQGEHGDGGADAEQAARRHRAVARRLQPGGRRTIGGGRGRCRLAGRTYPAAGVPAFWHGPLGTSAPTRFGSAARPGWLGRGRGVGRAPRDRRIRSMPSHAGAYTPVTEMPRCMI